ncbi:MAG TPA: nucleotidyltransferase domain-containing protein [Polyangia bacterium]
MQALSAFFASSADDVPQRDIAAVYLFGSIARDEARPGSDADVGILYVRSPPATLDAVPTVLESTLTRLLGVPAQVVVLNGAPVDLVQRVLRDGVLVCERDRSARVSFEVKSRNLYWDLLPILHRYRRPVGAAS